MATLKYQFHVEGLEDDTLVVRGFEGQETLSSERMNEQLLNEQPCHGFRYELALASRLANLTPEMVVDKVAELTLYRDDVLVQRVNGIVRRFTQGDTGHHHTFYSLTLVPALERLSLRHNSRIFQLSTVPEIISILLQEMGINDYAFALTRDCAQREFCVQYRETDLDFLHRLAAEEGLVYSFIHEEGKHTLIFSDASDSLPKLGEPIPYNTLAGGMIESPYISALSVHTQSEVSQTALQDYSFKKPTYAFAQQAVGTEMDYQQPDYEHFDAPGRYKDDVSGKAFGQIRLDYLRRNAHTATGKSNQPLLRPGVKFDLQEHLDDTLNRDWLVVRVTCQGTQPQALEEAGGNGATTYANQFSLIPAHRTWRATPQAKPQVDGPMIATVVGPQGEEIFCDEHGRVKLHFPWDRYSNGDEHSSCWVRVSQGWAGSQYGMIAIPRIGHEVIVSFLNGDPDQPIVTGRTYHATNTAPYTLPDNKTKTVLRTETHQGQGYNELSFEDQAGSEQIYLHAQKDFDGLIENDHTSVIKHDKHLTVENDRFTQIKNNQHLTVGGESRTKIVADRSVEIAGASQNKVAKLIAVQAGREISLKGGTKIVVEAGAEVTLKAGGSFVKVDAGGVHLSGSAINLNAGGSAGSGSGYGGKSALLAKNLVSLESPAELQLAAIQSTQVAGEANVVTVSELVAPVLGEGVQQQSASSQAASGSAVNSTQAEPQAENDVESTKEPRLKSDVLKPSETLNQLADREVASYKTGSKGQEVELIQKALIKLGFDLGTYGADGSFGSTTERQVKMFQQSYTPSHSTHPDYKVGKADGIVGQGTLLGLDEALVDGWVCELITKGMLDTVCPGSGNDQSLLAALNKYCPLYEINTPVRISHFLAQVAHESGCFSSLVEGSNYQHMAAKIKFSKYSAYVNSLKPGSVNRFLREDNPSRCKQPDLFNFVYSDSNGNGDESSGDGYKYRGRGLIQITGKGKYEKFTTTHNAKSTDDLRDFSTMPELVSDNIDYAVESACMYWRNWGALSKKFNANGDINVLIDNAPDDIKLVSQAVNGGNYGSSNGLEDRMNKFDKLKIYFGL